MTDAERAARLAASVANAQPLTWHENDRGSLEAEVNADNVTLCTLTVHPLGSGSYGRGHMWWLEGASCGAGGDAPSVPTAKRCAIECAIACLDSARATLVAATAGEGETTSEQGRSQPGGREEIGHSIKRVSTTVAAKRT